MTPYVIRIGAWTLRRPLVYDAIVLAIAALFLAYLGIGGATFWLILGAFAAVCLVFEVAYAVHCRRRGTRAGEVRAGLADQMLRQVDEQKGADA